MTHRTKSTTANKTNSRTITPISTETLATDLAPAWSAAWGCWSDLALTDGLDTTALRSCFDALRHAAAACGITTLGGMLADPETILAASTGLPASAVHQYISYEQAEMIHRHRNLLVAIASTTALLHEDDPGDAGRRIPAIRSYRGSQGRLAHDDEILLGRIETEHCLRTGGRLLSTAAKWVLTDAGLWPSETCLVRPIDLDDDSNPTTVHARGCGSLIQPRDLPLGGYHRRALRRVLDLCGALPGYNDHTTIAYTPTANSTHGSLSATATSAITVHYWNAGIRDATLKGASVLRWRVGKIVEEHLTSHPARIQFLAGKKDLAKALAIVDRMPAPAPRPSAGKKIAWEDEFAA